MGKREAGRKAVVRIVRWRRVIISSLVLLLAASHAWAWGSEGHRIVAEIAEQFLEPPAARQVRDLLAIENATGLAAVSNWADEIRAQRRNTAPWHFVDIPIGAKSYNRERDCPRGDCVVVKIDEFVAELRDRRRPPAERLEALKFIVHFIGDVHQPLHASNNNDRGGNDVRVEFMGRRTNLHAVWDTGILAPAVRGDERAYALRLAHAISPRYISKWRDGSAADWANESHAVAQRTIYGELPHNAGYLPDSYERVALPIANEQLEKAGIRLAAVLNTVLR
jgi:hypothetical protein